MNPHPLGSQWYTQHLAYCFLTFWRHFWTHPAVTFLTGKGGVGMGPHGQEQSLWAMLELHCLLSCPRCVTSGLIDFNLCSLGSHSSFWKPYVNVARWPLRACCQPSGREPRTPVSSLIHSLSPGWVTPVALSPRPSQGAGGQGPTAEEGREWN